jgi:phosphoribosylformylglycinamidine cyclo-ligase
VLIGLPSTGLHTNGYSLARKLFFEVAGYKPTQYVGAIGDKAGAALMKVHRSYLSIMQKLANAGWPQAWRTSPAAASRKICRASCPKAQRAGRTRLLAGAAHLRALQRARPVPQDEMLRTFNMGVGLIVVVPADKFRKAQALLNRAEEKFHVIGRIVKADKTTERRVHFA